MSPTDTDVEILRLATAYYRYEAHRLQAARDRFDLQPTHFWQRVNALIDNQDAVAARPDLCLPLQRLRDRRLRRAS